MAGAAAVPAMFPEVAVVVETQMRFAYDVILGGRKLLR